MKKNKRKNDKTIKKIFLLSLFIMSFIGIILLASMLYMKNIEEKEVKCYDEMGSVIKNHTCIANISKYEELILAISVTLGVIIVLGYFKLYDSIE